MAQGYLAEKLRVLRARKGLTLAEAAGQAGITPDTLSDLERGKRHAYTPTLHKIAEGYGIPVEELLEEPVPLAEASQGARSSRIPQHVWEHVESQKTIEENEVDIDIASLYHLAGDTERLLEDGVKDIGALYASFSGTLRRYQRYEKNPLTKLCKENPRQQRDLAKAEKRLMEVRDKVRKAYQDHAEVGRLDKKLDPAERERANDIIKAYEQSEGIEQASIGT